MSTPWKLPLSSERNTGAFQDLKTGLSNLESEYHCEIEIYKEKLRLKDDHIKLLQEEKAECEGRAEAEGKRAERLQSEVEHERVAGRTVAEKMEKLKDHFEVLKTAYDCNLKVLVERDAMLKEAQGELASYVDGYHTRNTPPPSSKIDSATEKDHESITLSVPEKKDDEELYHKKRLMVTLKIGRGLSTIGSDSTTVRNIPPALPVSDTVMYDTPAQTFSTPESSLSSIPTEYTSPYGLQETMWNLVEAVEECWDDQCIKHHDECLDDIKAAIMWGNYGDLAHLKTGIVECFDNCKLCKKSDTNASGRLAILNCLTNNCLPSTPTDQKTLSASLSRPMSLPTWSQNRRVNRRIIESESESEEK